jgi:hypothetical protein
MRLRFSASSIRTAMAFFARALLASGAMITQFFKSIGSAAACSHGAAVSPAVACKNLLLFMDRLFVTGGLQPARILKSATFGSAEALRGLNSTFPFSAKSGCGGRRP